MAEGLSREVIEEIDNSKEIESLKKIEAALFIAGRFLTIKDMVMLTEVNPILLKEYLDKLVEKYSKGDSAIEIIKNNDTWKMDVKPDYFAMINKLATGSAEFTKAEQETLAVIAYKQPVKQSIIIKIRGNKGYDHIKRFIELNLLRAKREGHTQELSLTDTFYDYFNVGKQDIEDKGEE